MTKTKTVIALISWKHECAYSIEKSGLFHSACFDVKLFHKQMKSIPDRTDIIKLFI
jgi:hypothetical protein